MASEWVTGVFTLSGVALGVLLEPAKAAFASRARTRQARADRCGAIIEAASTCRHDIVALNAVHRDPRPNRRSPEQLQAMIQRYNDSKAKLRNGAALLRLSGPDTLADKAAEVYAAEDRLYGFLEEKDERGYIAMTLPPKLQTAVDELDRAISAFAQLARKYTR